MFEGRKLIIATQHQKEKVIVPIFESNLGINCFTPDNYNTDIFGTFSGELERTLNSYETVKAKCIAAMKEYNCDLGIASEGSFGAHPSIFFANADDEILIFIDLKNDIEIVVREISLETNFNATSVTNYEELIDFSNKVQFPSHAIILKNAEKDFSIIAKGIHTWDDLKEKYAEISLKYTTVYAETDMRAMYNPTRMKVIEKAACKLIEKIKSKCPKCETPGFGITSTKTGLKCSLCGSETRSIKSHIYSCLKCNYETEEMFPNGKKWEDPMYCDYCNP
ncbi:DUF6671 family protein [Flavobacterium luteum]|uniref:DUF6671 domain-containing protein n=1 Tax=Flavobacterium luteum TaxID=2026654 RepID=A0A7J5AJR9_9FLAO|nr:DUF6671 family protein [Flavobacterium luteum]KAB1157658.1 hypothetical protein F6464_00825 [Flavobacterium luteum]